MTGIALVGMLASAVLAGSATCYVPNYSCTSANPGGGYCTSCVTECQQSWGTATSGEKNLTWTTIKQTCTVYCGTFSAGPCGVPVPGYIPLGCPVNTLLGGVIQCCYSNSNNTATSYTTTQTITVPLAAGKPCP